jgi:hypothetical protein
MVHVRHDGLSCRGQHMHASRLTRWFPSPDTRRGTFCDSSFVFHLRLIWQVLKAMSNPFSREICEPQYGNDEGGLAMAVQDLSAATLMPPLLTLHGLQVGQFTDLVRKAGMSSPYSQVFGAPSQTGMRSR